MTISKEDIINSKKNSKMKKYDNIYHDDSTIRDDSSSIKSILSQV